MFKFPFELESYNQITTVAISATEILQFLITTQLDSEIVIQPTTQTANEEYFKHKISTVINDHTRKH